MRDNVLSIDGIMANGQTHYFGPVSGTDFPWTGELCKDLLALGAREAQEIGVWRPKVMRRLGGYNTNALVPGDTPNNLAHLLVGSEATLAYSTAIELKLWPLITEKVLEICLFSTFRQAMEAAQHLVTLKPQGKKLVVSSMIALARDIPLFRHTIEIVVSAPPRHCRWWNLPKTTLAST